MVIFYQLIAALISEATKSMPLGWETLQLPEWLRLPPAKKVGVQKGGLNLVVCLKVYICIYIYVYVLNHVYIYIYTCLYFFLWGVVLFWKPGIKVETFKINTTLSSKEMNGIYKIKTVSLPFPAHRLNGFSRLNRLIDMILHNMHRLSHPTTATWRIN